jgi:hypothetical protein
MEIYGKVLHIGNRPENIPTGDKGYVNNSRLVFNTPPRNEVSAVKHKATMWKAIRVKLLQPR